MTILKCDRCGKEMSLFYATIEIRTPSIRRVGGCDFVTKKDLCPNCAGPFLDIVKKYFESDKNEKD